MFVYIKNLSLNQHNIMEVFFWKGVFVDFRVLGGKRHGLSARKRWLGSK